MDESHQWLNKGLDHYKNGDYNGAIQAFDRAVSINPSLSEAWNNRGLALAKIGQYQNALQSFDKALSLNPNYENAKNGRKLVLEILEEQIRSEDPINSLIRSEKLDKSTSKEKSPYSLTPIQKLQTQNLRNPWIATILSLFFPGWGQWYNGQRWEGLKWLGILLGWVIITRVVTGSNISLDKISIFSIVACVIYGYNIADAYNTANKINQGEVTFIKKSRLFWIPVSILLITIISVIVFGIAGSIGPNSAPTGTPTPTMIVPKYSLSRPSPTYPSWTGSLYQSPAGGYLIINKEGQAVQSGSVVINNVFVTAIENTAVLQNGEEYAIKGNVTGSPDFVYIWIFGPNEMIIKEAAVRPDSTYEFIISSYQTQNFEAGQYFVLIQHPMENNMQDVFLMDGKFASRSNNVVNTFAIENLNSSERAEMALQLLNDMTIDDIYAKLTFKVE